jgi:hypothetical protein
MTAAHTTSHELLRYRVHPQAAHRRVGGEFFVVTSDRAFHRLRLSTAVDVFAAMVAAPSTHAELVALLCQRYQVDAEAAGRDLTAYLQDLLAKQLICVAQPATERAA